VPVFLIHRIAFNTLLDVRRKIVKFEISNFGPAFQANETKLKKPALSKVDSYHKH
jgi:hypothetical protein